MGIDTKTGLSDITKQPDEILIRRIPFANYLATGDTINSVVSVLSTTLYSGIGTITINDITYDNTNVQATFSSGTANEDYKITALVTTTSGEKIERDVILKVRSY